MRESQPVSSMEEREINVEYNAVRFAIWGGAGKNKRSSQGGHNQNAEIT